MPMYEISISIDLPESFGSFQEVEKQILEKSREAGRELLGKVLLGYEETALGKLVHQKKDRLEKTVKTLLGELKILRWRVKDIFSKKMVKPLDEWMGLKSHEEVSVGLREAIVQECVDRPYGLATVSVNESCGVKRSVVGNWKLVQRHSERLQNQTSKLSTWRGKSLAGLKSGESDPCPILGMDPDATYVRGRRKTDKNHSLKMAVIYSGKKPCSVKNRRRRYLVDKQVVIGEVDGEADQLFDRVTDKAIRDYGAHGETRMICHGDGDPWIKQFKEDYPFRTLNRLDPYHGFVKIQRDLKLEVIPKDWREDFYKAPDALIQKIKNLSREFADEEEREKAEKLAQYFENNREGMGSSGASKEFKKAHPFMYLRGSGTIESNIFWTICRRFKAPRMMWSKRGLNNLAFLRERQLNASLKFERKASRKNALEESQRMKELRELAKDLSQRGEIHPDYYRLFRA